MISVLVALLIIYRNSAPFRTHSRSVQKLIWTDVPARRGGGALLKNCNVTLIIAPPGRSVRLPQGAFDLPGRADSKVALHLSDRRGPPLLEGGAKQTHVYPACEVQDINTASVPID